MDYFSDEHVHVMLNHIPVIALGIGVFLMAYGLLRRQSQVLGLGFFLAVVCALLMLVVSETGEEAAHSFKKGALAKLIDPASLELIEAHEERAEKAEPVVYGAGIVSLLGLLSLWKVKDFSGKLGILAVIAGTVGVGMQLWAADAGGKIRHPEFRSDAPATSSVTSPILAKDND